MARATILITALLVSTPEPFLRAPFLSVQDFLIARASEECPIIVYFGDTATIFSSEVFLEALGVGFGIGFQGNMAEADGQSDALDVALEMVDALGDVVGGTIYVDTTIEEDRFAVRLVTR